MPQPKPSTQDIWALRRYMNARAALAVEDSYRPNKIDKLLRLQAEARDRMTPAYAAWWRCWLRQETA